MGVMDAILDFLAAALISAGSQKIRKVTNQECSGKGVLHIYVEICGHRTKSLADALRLSHIENPLSLLKFRKGSNICFLKGRVCVFQMMERLHFKPLNCSCESLAKYCKSKQQVWPEAHTSCVCCL